jgi:hypothetical protein
MLLESVFYLLVAWCAEGLVACTAVLSAHLSIAVLLTGKASSHFYLILIMFVLLSFEGGNGVHSHLDRLNSRGFGGSQLEREWPSQEYEVECLLTSHCWRAETKQGLKFSWGQRLLEYLCIVKQMLQQYPFELVDWIIPLGN